MVDDGVMLHTGLMRLDTVLFTDMLSTSSRGGVVTDHVCIC